MILGIWLKIGVPDGLVVEDNLAVDDRGDFTVAAAEIEADATTVEMPAQRCRAASFGRKVAGMDDFQRMYKHALRDHIRIKSTRRRRAIILGQLCRERCRPIEVNTKTAARPKEEFCNALQKSEVAGRLRMCLRQQLGLEMRNVAAGLLQGDAQRHSIGR